MLFKRADLEAIAAGRVTLAFRRWKRATVRAGGRLRTAAGELAIEALEPVTLKDLTLADARAAGYESLASLRAALRGGDGTLYRIRLRFAGADRRIALRERAHIDQAELDELVRKLARFDARAPWTAKVLRLVERSPEVPASQLARELGLATRAFKLRVRRLKELGLTESLSVGYRLSPRGSALLERWPEP